jgi:hypothetical protein
LNFDLMIAEIDQEIARLDVARTALVKASVGESAKSKPGRPRQATSIGSATKKALKIKKRPMSAAARKSLQLLKRRAGQRSTQRKPARSNT